MAGQRRGRRLPALAVGAFVGLTLGLGGCGSPPGAPRPTSSTAAPASPTTPLPPAAADGDDTAACADGTCDVAVRAGTDIPLRPGSRLRRLTVLDVTPNGVTLVGETADGGVLRGTNGVGGTSTLNDVRIEIRGVQGDTATLALRPAS